MTADDARDFCEGLQARVTQMGDRTGEGQYLGQCLSVIRGLAAQLDAAAVNNTPPAAIATPEPPSAAPDAHLGAEGGE